MDIKVTTLDGAAAGKLTLHDEIFGLEPARRHPAAHGALAAGQAPARARTRPRAARKSHRTGAKMYKQKGTGRARHSLGTRPAVPRRRQGPSVRSFASHAHDLPKKVRALALRHALSAKAQGVEASSSSTSWRLTEAKTKALSRQACRRSA